MRFYQFLTLTFLTILLFFPVQIDARIPYIIGAFALLLILYPESTEGPVFIKNLKKDLAKKNPITIFFLLFLLASLVSTIFSIDQPRSIIQFLLYCSYFVIFTSIRSIFPTLRSKELLVTCYLLLVTILSLISLYNTLIRHYVNRQQEGVSFMWIYYGHNHLSALLLFAIPIAFYFLRKHWKTRRLNVLLLATCYLFLVTLFFTFAFTSMISLAISYVITLLIFGGLTRRRNLTLGLGIVAVVSLFLLGTFLFPEKVGFRKTHAGSAVARSVYWQNAIDNFKERPLTGSGLDTFRIINKASKRKLPLGSYYTLSFPFQILSDAGILGLLSSVGLIISTLWQSGKQLVTKGKLINRDKLLFLAFFVGLLASTLNSMVDFDWHLPVVFLLFWIFAGFLGKTH